MNTLRTYFRPSRVAGPVAAALGMVLMVAPATYAKTVTGNTPISPCDTGSVSVEYGPPGTRLHHIVHPADCRRLDTNVSASLQAHAATCSNQLLTEYGQPGMRSRYITQPTGCAGR